MFLTMLQSSHGQEQKPGLEDFSLRSLQGIQEFGIIVDYSDLPGSLKAAKSLIEADVRNHLAAHPKLQHTIVNPPGTKVPFGSLWVSIRAKCNGASACAVAVSISFQQHVRSLVNAKTQFPVPTWIRQDLLVELEPGVVSKTRETLSALLDLFIADFLKANP
jgi:hypothetical protein